MEVRQEKPPAYSHHHHHHHPDSLQLPSVPTTDPQANNATEPIHLPDLKSLGLPVSTAHSRNTSLTDDQYHSHALPHHAREQPWQPSFTPLSHVVFPRVPSTAPRSVADVDMASPMDTESIMSMDEQPPNPAQRTDLNSKELMAVEAIVGLGNPDYIMSPSTRSATMQSQVGPHPGQEPEPLLSLLTSSHPWLGGTINNSMSAYSTTKAYSPRFIQYSADFVERNVANTVGTVGRRTGVEGSLRRYLGDRRPSDQNLPNHKRRRVEDDSLDIEQGLQTPPLRTFRARGDSDVVFGRDELLPPPYDSNRSPEYEERSDNQTDRYHDHRHSDSRPVHWSTRMIITTSGLGAALSEKSLRSLKFCLGILRQATNHLGNVMRALRLVLSDYESSTRPLPTDFKSSDSEKGVGSGRLLREIEEHQREAQARMLAERIKTLSEDIWQTLKNVVASVSRYTGGALPDNAGALVRRQLLSVPQRWQAASAASSQQEQDRSNGAPTEVRTANRMLAFATEGLDMMAQVSMVVESTIVSAEQWLDSLGRKRSRQSEETEAGDEKMGGGDRDAAMQTPLAQGQQLPQQQQALHALYAQLAQEQQQQRQQQAQYPVAPAARTQDENEIPK
ncbi:Opi1-domain-containing protein [Saccharata proteae CBS 121410]|uniref:Opi1-domain-containing protein n=1 Tax=Saccharata proteae CBS 121410 TaxID=1314787 RepID=A0A9P4HZE9_9PEZI|nr:Opi1-domain-containing protein [Saccharata proteae CBS 121410]